MQNDKNELEKGLRELREKAERLREESLEETQAVDILEEAVDEVERLGERLEDQGA